MANKIQIKRGLQTSLPTLSVGEPALTTNSGAEKVYIGTGSGNKEIPTLVGGVLPITKGGTGSTTLTSTTVGLGSVSNYGIATQAEAQAGTSNVKYMTPLRVKEAITKLETFRTIAMHIDGSILFDTVASYTDITLRSGTNVNTSSYSLIHTYTIPISKNFISISFQATFNYTGYLYFQIQDVTGNMLGEVSKSIGTSNEFTTFNIILDVSQCQGNSPLQFWSKGGTAKTVQIRNLYVYSNKIMEVY